MADGPDHSGDCPLRDAVVRFADPETVRAYEEAARAWELASRAPAPAAWPDSAARADGWLSRVDENWLSRVDGSWLDRRRRDPRSKPYGHPSQPVSAGEARLRRDRAWQALRDDLCARLLAGELIASGYQLPLRLDSGRVDVPPEKWTMLRPSFAKSSAKGPGLEVIDVRVRRADQGVASARRATEAVEPDGSFEGRPSIMRAIAQEMRRRAERGELCDTRATESRALAAWADENFPHDQVPKAASIYRQLGALYRELRGGKT